MRSAPASQDKTPSTFLQCAGCKKVLFAAEFEENFRVCSSCGHHHRLTAAQRIAIIFDEGTFAEHDADLQSLDPLLFPDYANKLAQAEQKASRKDGVVYGEAKLEGTQIVTAVSDFHFMGGSMGSVAGEKITRALELAAKTRQPAIVFCASGGARMQEGLLSLMQMAKTTAAVERLRETRLPYIAVFTDPTMAGVLASYASVADVILAEPKAQIGFAGARVSKQAGVGRVPDDFQTSEYCLRSGMIDRIVPRKELRSTLANLIRMFGGVGIG